jgi:signal peptidase II
LTASSVRKMQRGRANTPLFWSVLALVVIADVITKAIAVYALVPQRIPHELFGDAVRFTLVYNPGAAFGLHLGEYSRWIFMVLTIGALFILGRLYRATRDGDLVRTLAIALVCAGAVGNLIDRIRSAQGVVDFIDVGIGDARWPTFNVADMAVSVGAFLLAWVLWGEDNEIRDTEKAEIQSSTESPTSAVSMSASPAPGAEI